MYMHIYSYLPSICFFRSASKEDILWSLSGWNINLNWICHQFQIRFFTFLSWSFLFFLLDLLTVLIGFVTFLIWNFHFSHLEFSLFSFGFFTLLFWIFYFSLMDLSSVLIDFSLFSFGFFSFGFFTSFFWICRQF